MDSLMEHESNGTASLSAREAIATQIEAEISRCEQRRDQVNQQRAALNTEIAEIDNEIKSFRQAAQRLRGEPLIKQSPPGSKRGPYKQREGGTKLGQEAVDRIRDAVLLFARDHDEFRQIDIRNMPHAPTTKSSVTATGFEKLRQEGLIRLARKDGNNKFYRLTTEGLRLRDDDSSDER